MSRFGCIISPYDVRDYKIEVPQMQEFPKEFELEPCAVKNQKNVGSCVAHSVSEVVEYYNKQQEGSYIKMSTGFIYGNRQYDNYTGRGMHIRQALQAVCKDGNVTDEEFPYNIEVPEAIEKFKEYYINNKYKGRLNRISSYYRVNTESDIKTALLAGQPVVFSIYWYKDLRLLNNIIVSSQNIENKSGCHCMMIYGWDNNGWKIQNSWGAQWGNKGRAILPYDYKIIESWAVIDNIIGGNDISIKKPFSGDNVFIKLLVKIINAIVNIFRRNNT